MNTTNTQPSSTITDSKSIWKQIFSKSIKAKPVEDELKEQWSELDKNQPSNHYRFNKPTSGVKRTCPFYKKIPGKIHLSLVFYSMKSLSSDQE
jgi:adenine specific DNA methylase Mod